PATHPAPPSFPTRRSSDLPAHVRLTQALREPRRWPEVARHRTAQLGVRLALATGRPIPEDARERFFLTLHERAERAYEEHPYPGDRKSTRLNSSHLVISYA